MTMRFRIEATLGSGPDGSVCQARPERLGAHPVALRPVAVPRAARSRLRHDCEVLARIGHPGLATVEDVVELDDRTVLLAGPVAPDGTLADRLRLGPLPVAEAVPLVTALAGALIAAHRAGLTHRRLHPGNVLLGPAGPVIADLAQAGATARPSPTGDAVADDVAALADLAAGLVDPADPSTLAAGYLAACAAAPATGLEHLVEQLGSLRTVAASVDTPPAPPRPADDGVTASATLALVVAASTVVGVLLGAAGAMLPGFG